MKAMKAVLDVRSTIPFALALSALLLTGFLVGCGGEPEVDGDAVRAAALEELHNRKQALDAKRQQLADLRQQAEEGSEEATDEGADGGEDADGGEGADGTEEAGPTAEQQAETLSAEIEAEAEALGADIAAFINDENFPMYQGEPPSEHQQAAINLKVAEDILLAQEWVNKGGDYARALNVLEAVEPLAPDNADIQAELERVREMRYVTEERFSGIEKGQTDDEVKAILGPVNLRNIRDYDNDRIAWFYPKDAGGAAGVFFRKKGDDWVVYQADYEAVKPNAPGEG